MNGIEQAATGANKDSDGPATIETGLTDRMGTDGLAFRGSTFKAQNFDDKLDELGMSRT